MTRAPALASSRKPTLPGTVRKIRSVNWSGKCHAMPTPPATNDATRTIDNPRSPMNQFMLLPGGTNRAYPSFEVDRF